MITGNAVGLRCSFVSATILTSMSFTARLAIFDLIERLAISCPTNFANTSYLFAVSRRNGCFAFRSKAALCSVSLFINLTRAVLLASMPLALLLE